MRAFAPLTIGLLLSTTALLAPGLAAALTAAHYEAGTAQDIRASEALGARVYSTQDDVEALTDLSAADLGAYDDIGTITDLLMDREGRVQAVVVGVGGFLGIDEHHVALAFDTVRVVPDREHPGRVFFVVNTTKEALEAMPAYRSGTSEATAAAEMVTVIGMERPMLRRPVVEREGYSIARLTDVTTEALVGAHVYDVNDMNIGKVEELILGDDGTQVQAVVLDVGGFLGLGRHRVALAPDEVLILHTGHGGDVRVYVDTTKDELEALPRYEG